MSVSTNYLRKILKLTFCQINTFWIVDIFINCFWYFHQLFDLRYQLIVPVNHWVQFCHKSLHNINNWTFNLFSGFINWLVASEGIICSRLFDCDHKRRQLTVASHQSSLIEYKLAPIRQTWKQQNLLLKANFTSQYLAEIDKSAQHCIGHSVLNS